MTPSTIPTDVFPPNSPSLLPSFVPPTHRQYSHSISFTLSNHLVLHLFLICSTGFITWQDGFTSTIRETFPFFNFEVTFYQRGVPFFIMIPCSEKITITVGVVVEIITQSWFRLSQSKQLWISHR